MPRSFGTTNAAPYAAAPAVGAAGDTYFDTGLKQLFLSDGTQWIAIQAGSGTTTPTGKAAVFRYAGTDPTSFGASTVIPMNTIHEARNGALVSITDTHGSTLDFYAGSNGWVYVNKAGWYMVTGTVLSVTQPASNTWLSLVKYRAASDGAEGETTGSTMANRTLFLQQTYAHATVVWEGWLAAGDRVCMMLSASLSIGVPAPGTSHGNDPYSPQLAISSVGGVGPTGPTGPTGPDISAAMSSYYYGVVNTGSGNMTSGALNYQTFAQLLANGMTMPATDRVQVSQTGKYLVHTQMGLYASSATMSRTDTYIEQYSSGGGLKVQRRIMGNGMATVGYNFQAVAAATFDVVAGDYFRVAVQPNGAGCQMDFSGSYSYMEIVPVGGTKGDQGVPGPPGTGTGAGSATLTNTTNSPSGTWIDWGSQILIPLTAIPLGTNTSFMAFLTGYANDFTTTTITGAPPIVRMAASFDGGATWTYSPQIEENPLSQASTLYINRAAISASYLFTGVVGAQVRLKAQCYSVSTAGNVSFNNGQLSWLLPGGVTGPTGPDVTASQSSYFYAQGNSGQALTANTQNAINWGAAFLNNGFTATAGQSQVYFTRTGKYRVAAQLSISITGTATATTCRVVHYNSVGTVLRDQWVTGSPSNNWGAAEAELIADATAGDYIIVYCDPSGSTTATLANTRSALEISPIGGVKGDTGATGPAGPDATLAQSAYWFGQGVNATGIGTANTVINLTQTLANNASLVSSNRVTPTYTGKYIATAQLEYIAGSASQWVDFYIRQFSSGGVQKAQVIGEMWAPNTNANQLTAQGIFDVVAGDYFQISVTFAASATNQVSTYTYFNLEPVGGTKGDTGAQGIQGATGPQGQNVGFAAKGEWASATSYVPMDVVSRNGVAFVAMSANSGVDPGTLPQGSFAAIADMQALFASVGKSLPWVPVIKQQLQLPINIREAWYARVGEWVIGVCEVVITGSGNSGQIVSCDPPVAIRQNVNPVVGSSFLVTGGANQYGLVYVYNNLLTPAVGGSVWSTQLVNGNIWSFTFMYLAPVGV